MLESDLGKPDLNANGWISVNTEKIDTSYPQAFKLSLALILCHVIGFLISKETETLRLQLDHHLGMLSGMVTRDKTVYQ